MALYFVSDAVQCCKLSLDLLIKVNLLELSTTKSYYTEVKEGM